MKMTTTLSIVSFLFLVFSLWLEGNTVESYKYDSTREWVKHNDPSNCEELQSSYSEAFVVNDRNECKQRCEKDIDCLLYEFRDDHSKCRLSNKRRFKTIKDCTFSTEIYIKPITGCPEPGRGEICQENAVCVSEDPYQCRCKDGYHESSDGKCIKEPHPASQNVAGKDGYECTKDSKRPCPENSSCVKNGKKHECKCKQGLKFNPGKWTCEDIDECAKGPLCGENMECKNTIGSYKCSCRKGYWEDLYWCNDVDECDESICGGRMCVNVPGSYKCTCPPSGPHEIGNCTDEDVKNPTVPSFSGNSYMRFDTPAVLKSKASFRIWLTIRPTNRNGIIFYAEKYGHENFFGVALNDSNLEISFNLGSGPQRKRDFNSLKVNVWHRIEVIFSGYKVGFTTDPRRHALTHEGRHDALDVDDIFFVGGVSNASDATPNVVKNLGMNSGFQGCLGHMRIGDVDYDLTYPGKHIRKQEHISRCENVNEMDECAKKNFCGTHSVCTNMVGSYRCSCKQGYKYADEMSSQSCTVDSEDFVMRDGWLALYGSCKSAKCREKMGVMTLDKCKELCANKSSCKMLRYRPSNSKCYHCQAVALRVPSKKSTLCAKETSYDFYRKVVAETTEEATDEPDAQSLVSEDGKETYEHKGWIVLRRLCVRTNSYNPQNVLTAPECKRRCREEPGCVMAKFSPAASLCWLSKDREMAPLGSGCDGKFRNIYDYYVKPLYECDESDVAIPTGGECPKHSECVLEKGHGYCKCDDGFEEQRKSEKAMKCADINECALYSGLCGKHAHCINTPGSYKCRCKKGYHGDGFVCVRKKKQGRSSGNRG